jgi:hypothetical protein
MVIKKKIIHFKLKRKVAYGTCKHCHRIFYDTLSYHTHIKNCNVKRTSN